MQLRQLLLQYEIENNIKHDVEQLADLLGYKLEKK